MLSGFDTLSVCTRYRGNDEASFDVFPYHQSVLHHASRRVRRAAGLERGHHRLPLEADLPEAARDYLDFIADFLGVPIVLVGVGPGREQIIWTEAGDRLNAAAA